VSAGERLEDEKETAGSNASIISILDPLPPKKE